MYNYYQEQIRAWKRQTREELKVIEAQEYEKYGLEVGVDPYEKLQFAQNMASLLGLMEGLQVAIEGQEANEQFEGFFRGQ